MFREAGGFFIVWKQVVGVLSAVMQAADAVGSSAILLHAGVQHRAAHAQGTDLIPSVLFHHDKPPFRISWGYLARFFCLRA